VRTRCSTTRRPPPRVALAHLAEQRVDLGVFQDLVHAPPLRLGQVELEGPGRRLVGEHQLVEGVGHEDGVGNAVDDRLGVLALGGGDPEADLGLAGPQPGLLRPGRRTLRLGLQAFGVLRRLLPAPLQQQRRHQARARGGEHQPGTGPLQPAHPRREAGEPARAEDRRQDVQCGYPVHEHSGARGRLESPGRPLHGRPASLPDGRRLPFPA
jgi:hypothetical protein